jgi:prophage regulatory protein
MSDLPSTALLRLPEIIGDRRKGIRPLIPISRTKWYSGIRQGMFPKPIKLGGRVSVWRASDIRALIEKIGVEDE